MRFRFSVIIPAVFAILGFLNGVPAGAADSPPTPKSQCSDVDLRSLTLGPVRNQGIEGMCFAYAAADLITLKLGQKVSAVDTALAYHHKTRFPSIVHIYRDGGYTAPTIAGVEELGACPENFLPSDENESVAFDPKLDGRVKTNLLLLEKLYKKRASARELGAAAKLIFPQIGAEDARLAMETSKTARKFLRALTDRNCENRRLVLDAKFKSKSTAYPNGGGPLLKTLNAQLTKKNAVAIGYMPDEMYSEEIRFSATKMPPVPGEPESEDPGFHASSIIGRRWNERAKSCEYLVRDSFTANPVLYKTDEYDFEEGHIWVGEEFVRKNVYEVEYLE